MIIILLFILILLLQKRPAKTYTLKDHLDDYGFKGEFARFVLYAPPGSVLHIGTVYRSDNGS